ncbi:putative trancriptional regulator, ArsR family [Halapricum desulfuricans]|uniref:Putative trancriptional regulator, ArsR family n=2 Tax=Halapricum desulfuricans TaxID=2841257 RepID=A0A897NH08_9EURY|nr:putative trancriptional regulator, ArsR family [Halapricum desulfuricans]
MYRFTGATARLRTVDPEGTYNGHYQWLSNRSWSASETRGGGMSEATSSTGDLSTSVSRETIELEDAGVETDADAEALSLDTIFDALKNARRRRALRYLDAADEQLEIGDLAERIAADENDKTTDEISYAERKRVYVALYQCHLPKLDDMDIVSYDKSRGMVTLRERAAQLQPYLARQPMTRRWPRYYAAVVSVGALALAGSWLLTPSTLVVQFVLLGVLLAVVACTTAHAWSVAR